MTSDSQVIVYNPDVNLTERKSNLNNDIQEVVTVGDLRGYKVYTALLTQSGGDEPDSLFGGQGSILDFGQTYFIASNPDNYDLTIYGAANSNVGTYFVCNDPTSPVLVYTDSLQLDVNYGAPLVTVLENTIGNIWLTYNGIGGYLLYRDSDFIPKKVFAILTNNLSGNIGLVGDNMALGFECYPNAPYIAITSTTNGVGTDGVLYNTPNRNKSI